MKVTEFDTRKPLTPSMEILRSITASSPLSDLVSDSDMDAEGDPDPECVNVPQIAENVVTTTISCGAYSSDMDAEGDYDPEFLASVPMIVDDEVVSTLRGVDSPENQTTHSERVEEASLMNVDGETNKSSEPMVPGNNLGEGSSSTALNQSGASALASASSDLNVAPQLRTQILDYWGRYYRHRKDTIETEKLWAKEHSTGILGNCSNCKPGNKCILETGRAKCLSCVRKKTRCSHMDTFKIEWIAGQLETTLSVVQAVVNSRAPKKQRPLRASRPQEVTATTSTKRRTSRSARTSVVSSDNREASPVKKRPTSKRLEATATTSTQRQISRTLNPYVVPSTPDAVNVIDREEVVSFDQEKNIDIGSNSSNTSPTPLPAHAGDDVHDGQNLSLEHSPNDVDFVGGDNETSLDPLVVPAPSGVLDDPNLEQARFDVGAAGEISTRINAQCNDGHADWTLEQSSSEAGYAGTMGGENVAFENFHPVEIEDIVDDNTTVPELLITEEADQVHVPPFDSRIHLVHEPSPEFRTQYDGHNLVNPRVNEDPNDIYADRSFEQSFSETSYAGDAENEEFRVGIVTSPHVSTHLNTVVAWGGVVKNSAPPRFPITRETCPLGSHSPHHLAMPSPDVAIVNDIQAPSFNPQMIPAHEASVDLQTGYNDLTPLSREDENEDMRVNARLEAFINILEAEAAMKNAGCPEEVQYHFNGLMEYCEALFRG